MKAMWILRKSNHTIKQNTNGVSANTFSEIKCNYDNNRIECIPYENWVIENTTKQTHVPFPATNIREKKVLSSSKNEID